jgi:replication initiation protein RepC
MYLGNHSQALPANPRHVSPAADRYRAKYDRAPALDEKGLLPGHLLAAFKGAARYMGLRGNIIVAMDYLFGLTRAQDWMGDSRPIVWPSAREQSEALGLSLSGVKFLNRRLIELGLILAKDSPTGARWGRRGHNGQIIEAYGFDLSPLAHRAAEFATIRDAGREDDRIRAQLRRRKTVAIKSIGQIVRTAAEQDIDTPELYALADHIWPINDALSVSADRATLVRAVEELERLRARVYQFFRDLVAANGSDQADSSSKALDPALKTTNTNPAGSFDRPPNNNYKPTDNPSVRKGSEESSSEFSGRSASTASPEKETVLNIPTVRPKEVISLAPLLGRYLNQDLERLDMERSIVAVLVAAEACAFKELGVSKSLWQEAQKEMGMWPAALAVMLVAAKDPDYFSRTPAHYFAGMVAKAKDGTLRLDRSIWGLRTHAGRRGAGFEVAHR